MTLEEAFIAYIEEVQRKGGQRMSNADPGRARPVFQWLAQLFALMGKESKQIIRDPSSYLVAAILP